MIGTITSKISQYVSPGQIKKQEKKRLFLQSKNRLKVHRFLQVILFLQKIKLQSLPAILQVQKSL
jgi:hypothetical protein